MNSYETEFDLKAICSESKLSLWNWDISRNHFVMSGYFDPIDGTLDDFLNTISSFDRISLEKTLLQRNEPKASYFEKTVRLQRDPDSVKWVFMRGQLQAGESDKMHGIFLGVTDWKQSLDNQYLQQLKLMEQSQSNSRNEIISMLAHELTQPLMVINTYLSGCIYRLQENKINNNQLIDIMSIIKHNAALAGQRIHDLKDFLDEFHLEYRKENIHKVIQEAISLLSYELESKNINIHFDLQDNLPEIKMSKKQIIQVLYNLIKDSIESFSTHSINISIKTKKLDDDSIQVMIIDNQTSLNLETINPLSNLHTKSERSKMGLAMCLTIIEAHGGTLSHVSSANSNLYQFTIHSGHYESRSTNYIRHR